MISDAKAGKLDMRSCSAASRLHSSAARLRPSSAESILAFVICATQYKVCGIVNQNQGKASPVTSPTQGRN
jgi:hypothetical protein